MLFSCNMKMEHLLENERAKALVDQFFPGLCSLAASHAQAKELSVQQLVRYAGLPGAAEKLPTLDLALQELNLTERTVSASEEKLMERFRSIWEAEQNISAEKGAHHQDAIYPGQPWLDTEGKRIQAHGGAVFYEKGVYYWYGENKTYTDGKNSVWTWGIKVYSSCDLYNWEDRGYLIAPVIDDPNSGLFPAKRVDRPHILKCERTGKYVCWIKLSGAEAAFTVWQADALLGPYAMVENLYYPGGHRCGDFDIVEDRETAAAYLFVEVNHDSLLCMELTEDYLHAAREVCYNYPNQTPPFTREAPALFEANGMKYMLTSGMTGYVPNKSDSAAAHLWTDCFVSLGDPHENDDSCASFNSQISKVFKVEGRDNLYIAMADRWLPGYHVDKRIADLFTRVIAGRFAPTEYSFTAEESAEVNAANVLETADTSVADYVWLPILVTPPDREHPFGRITIRWSDSWRIE